jgi:hypothetical protein
MDGKKEGGNAAYLAVIFAAVSGIFPVGCLGSGYPSTLEVPFETVRR